MGMVLTMILTALFVVEVKAERLQITNDGPVAAYFAGSTAGYDSTMYVVAGGLYEPPQVLPVFDNHGVWFGTENILGSFSAGDYFQPVLLVHTTGEAWWGNPSSNSDGLGHMIATGLTLDNGTHGVLVRFEDLAGGEIFNQQGGDRFRNVPAQNKPWSSARAARRGKTGASTAQVVLALEVAGRGVSNP